VTDPEKEKNEGGKRENRKRWGGPEKTLQHSMRLPQGTPKQHKNLRCEKKLTGEINRDQQKERVRGGGGAPKPQRALLSTQHFKIKQKKENLTKKKTVELKDVCVGGN